MKYLAIFVLFFYFAFGITIHRDTLSNGLVILTCEAHKIPLVEIKVAIRAGSVFDPKGKDGLANLLNQLLLRGTERYPDDMIVEMVESVGGVISPFTDEDYAGLRLRVLSKDLPMAVELIADCLKNPLLDTLELKKIKRQTISGLRADMDDPSYLGMVNFRKTLFKKHPLNHLSEGFDTTISYITTDDVVQFYKDYYLPNNTFLVFVGDFIRDSLLKIVEREFSGWERRDFIHPNFPPGELPGHPIGLIIKREISQTYIFLGFIGPDYSAKDYLGARIMNYILGGSGLTSRIATEIREKRGLAYAVYSYFQRFHYGGYFLCEVQTRKESAGEVLKTIIGELKKMKEGDIKEKELDGSKRYYTGHFPLTFDTYREMCDLITEIEITGLPLDYPEIFERMVLNISLNDVNLCASKYLHPDNFSLVIVGNIEKEELGLEGIEWQE